MEPFVQYNVSLLYLQINKQTSFHTKCSLHLENLNSNMRVFKGD